MSVSSDLRPPVETQCGLSHSEVGSMKKFTDFVVSGWHRSKVHTKSLWDKHLEKKKRRKKPNSEEFRFYPNLDHWGKIQTEDLKTALCYRLSNTRVINHQAAKMSTLRQDPPLEAILVIFGRRALIFFCLKALGKKWKMTPLLCACAVVITLETQKCRKGAPRSVEFNFFNNCDRHKRFSQNERRRADLQNVASDFLIFA